MANNSRKKKIEFLMVKNPHKQKMETNIQVD